MDKSETAFRTIGEVSDDLGIPQHILRYWETRFPQLKPMQRAGNRRYYRPDDIALVRRINGLLNDQGYTVKGVQALLSGKTVSGGEPAATAPVSVPRSPPALPKAGHVAVEALIGLRDRLARALTEDDIAARV